ncbi:MAG TPA: ABC transporter ATP-binding protein [Amycolatopsis sp.]|nr:ABC transporter ATP-binding protein [Amycolatopsis sp.]
MTAQLTEPVLEVSGLVAGYRGSEILHGVDLRIEPGEVVGVIGPNGAGKSTMLNTLAGAHPARSGRTRVSGTDVSRWAAAKRVPHGVVLVPEGRQVFAALSVRENLWLGSFSAPRTRAERLATVYDLFPRLRERSNQAAGTLSGGEQQMLAIGRGLMASPTLLMIDEPSLGLAPVLIETMIEQLARIRAELGITMLIAEQGLNLAAETCGRIYVVASGQIVAEVGPDVSERRLSELYLGSNTSNPIGPSPT